MANFTVSWIAGSGVYRQDLYLKPKYSGSYQMIATVDGTVNSQLLQGLQDNLIYQFKIVSYCDAGTPSDGTPKELINFICPTLTLTPNCNGVIDYSFTHVGGDIDEYDVVLYTNGGTEITRQTKAVAATVTGSFSSLANLTPYKVRVIPKADTNSKTNCTQVTTTTVDAGPVVASSPSSISRCDDGPNSNTILTATFTGTVTSYSWYRNGVLITNGGNYSGATTNALSIQNAGSVLGSFVCRATATCGYVETTPAVITLLGDTAITTQPSIIPNCVVDPVNLSVTASGDTLTYQWQKSTDGGSTYSDIAGASSSTYQIAAGTAVEGHKYRVKVNSTCGPELTSTAATVDIIADPVFTLQPVNTQVCTGSNATLTVAYTGESIVSGNWQRLITGVWTDLGTTATSLVTSTVGTYRYKVTNSCTTVYSSTADVTNYTNLSYASKFGTATICEQATFSISNTVTGTITSQTWEISTDGGVTYTIIPGATTSSLSIGPVTYAMSGYKYRHTAVGPCNTITNVSNLFVFTPLSIVTQPTDQTICLGNNYNVSVTATAGWTITYQWQQSTNGTTWTNITGATSNTLARTASAVGVTYFRCFVSHCGAGVYTNVVTATVITTPTISVQPVNSTTCAGQTAQFVTDVLDATSLQWQQNVAETWVNINGETGEVLNLSSVTVSMSGNQYRLAATNSCGTVYSNVVTLFVNSSTPVWVNRDINTYYVCVGVDKHYQQIDTNSCSATYNQTQTGALYQANSVDCGGTPVCNPPTVTTTTFEQGLVSQCLDGLIIEAIYLHASSDQALLPASYTHPCTATIGQHVCNRAFFEIFGNGVYLGDVRLNNNSGTGGPTTQSGGFTCQDYNNTPGPLTNNTWVGNVRSRYSKIILTQSQAIAVANAAGNSTINFTLTAAITTYTGTCDGTSTPHTNVTWVRISRQNGQVLYNGCPVSNVATINVCSNSQT